MSKRKRGRYACLDAGLWSNDKHQGVSLAAEGLWARMLSFCADKLTDGRVRRNMILAMGAGAEEALAELLESGLVVEDGEHLLIHDYLEHNMSRADWDKRKRQARTRKRKQRQRAAEKPSDSEGVCDDDVTTDVTRDIECDSRVSHSEVSNSHSLNSRDREGAPDVAYADPLNELAEVSPGQLATRMWVATLRRKRDPHFNELLLDARDRQRLQDLTAFAVQNAAIRAEAGEDWGDVFAQVLSGSLKALEAQHERAPERVKLKPGYWWGCRDEWMAA